jgi:U4/U6 small nuclear ribonucleoprotein PRP4
MSRDGVYFGSLEDELGELFNAATRHNTQLQLQQSAAGTSAVRTLESVRLSGNDAAEDFSRARDFLRSLRIPTDDVAVRQSLVGLREPVTVFGEGPAERRDRLRSVVGSLASAAANEGVKGRVGLVERHPQLASMLPEGFVSSERLAELLHATTPPGTDTSTDLDEEFYVPGPMELLEARRWLASDSLARAKERFQTARSKPPTEKASSIAARQASFAVFVDAVKRVELRTQLRDDRPAARPISALCIGRDFLAWGDWSGSGVVHNVNGEPGRIDEFSTGSRVTALAWNPIEPNLLAFGDNGGQLGVRRVGSGSAVTLSGPMHSARVTGAAWHPSGRFLATASLDTSWRLWDFDAAATGQTAHSGFPGTELQLQEGHLGGVGALAWHPDGGLLVTGPAMASPATTTAIQSDFMRVWDVRQGRSLWSWQVNTGSTSSASAAVGHIHFNPTRTHLFLTAGSDGVIRCHDLRRLEREVVKIAAHSGPITGCKFTGPLPSSSSPADAYGLGGIASGGADGRVVCWSEIDGRLLRDFCVDSKVTVLDCRVNEDRLSIYAAGYDRIVRIFQQ